MLGRVLVVVLTRRSYQIGILYRCRGSSRPATVLGYSYNCQTAVCTDTCSNQLMKFCPCNGVMRRLGSRFRTRKTCSKRATLPPNKDGGFVATENHVIVTSCRPPECSLTDSALPRHWTGTGTSAVTRCCFSD